MLLANIILNDKIQSVGCIKGMDIPSKRRYKMLQVFYCDPRGRNLSLKNMIGKTLPEIIRVPYVFKYVNHLEEVAKEVKPYSILFYYLEGGG